MKSFEIPRETQKILPTGESFGILVKTLKTDGVSVNIEDFPKKLKDYDK